MSQIDEIWILFLVITSILIVVFVVLRQAHGENYSGTVADLPKFNINRSSIKPVTVSNYEEIPEETIAPKPRQVEKRSQAPTAKQSSTFDKDVTDPSVYMFRSHIRLPSKSAQQVGADPFRGDIHITPVNRNGHFQSRYGKESLRHDTMFNSVFAQNYNQLTDYQLVNEELVARH